VGRLRSLGCAVDVARQHLLVPVAELDQLDFVLLELTVGEMVCGVLLFETGMEVDALVQDLLVLAVPGEQDSRTAEPSISRISRRNLRSARSAPSRAGSAAAEFCRYTAPNDLSRRQTAARKRVGSAGIR
jgi:hypothetical protein